LRFRFGNDQRRYLLTLVLLRTVLSRYAVLDPAQWSFALNAYGKPEIANPGHTSASASTSRIQTG
jgi:4'-phosphopantetheinyl transferase